MLLMLPRHLFTHRALTLSFFLFAWSTLAHPNAHAQAFPAGQPAANEAGAITPDATTNDSGPVGIVPLVHGFNASLTSTSQHDSDSGWSSILQPTLAYRFSLHFSVFANATTFPYILIQNVVSNHKKTITSTDDFRAHHFVFGDTTVNATYEAHSRLFDYAGTGTLGIPTGNTSLGLSTGQVTWNANNHFERPVADWLTPELELGIGDSENLNNSRIRRNFVTVGTLAHFEVGANVSLPFHLSLSSDAYEDLPIGPQTVTTIAGKGKKASQLASNAGGGIAEDNGFTNSLDLPLNGHITLSGIYNHSLRNDEDIAGFSLTLTLRRTPDDPEDTN